MLEGEGIQVLTLVTVIGDFAGMLLALYLVQIAMQVDLPQPVVSQMMTNVVLDFLVSEWVFMAMDVCGVTMLILFNN